MMNQTHTIAVDFDGTCVTHDYPKVGKDIGAAKVLRALTDNGHKLILLTMRNHNELRMGGRDTLNDAVGWFSENDIPLYGVNENPDQTWSDSRKVYADLYIDDGALGVPLRYRKEFSPRPFVDWKKTAYMLYELGLISEDQLSAMGLKIII